MADKMKCACTDCMCMVAPDKAVIKEGQAFCCEECAAGHVHHAGCEHSGCECHG